MSVGHRMPFGARVDGASTTFRLWAPGARTVALAIGRDGTDRRAMSRDDEGWYQATLADAGPGTRYAYRIDDELSVPDPASRCNPDGVHAASMVVDPGSYRWRTAWQGRPWHEAVVYELHVGTFTDAGTYAAVADRFDHLLALGVTAIELMPVAAFAGQRGWGYDGVLPFAPHAAYGTPDDLKRLVDDAHARGLMVLLDVVYNHFGPEGNYLHRYAPQFFNPAHATPWGAAINFDGPHNANVREFFIHNALYWLDEFRFDGLRLDAVHAIVDDTTPYFVDELAARVRERFGDRHVHLVLENDRNEARRLHRDERGRPLGADAQWNDDFHHALHVLITGERDGYYADYTERPLDHFGRALAEGFIWQGQPSPFRGGQARGEPSAALPPTAFVTFAQNHDQTGNRALGERIHTLADPARLRTAIAAMLAAPSIPMVYMGEEFAASAPFLFFCDYGPELADAVARGRREEFAAFGELRPEDVPDPNAIETFIRCKLDWSEAVHGTGRDMLQQYRHWLARRRDEVVPLLPLMHRGGTFRVDGDVLHLRWPLSDGRALVMVADFGASADGDDRVLLRVENAR
jgi:maltooligosyltrehalose trehalohydrolase